MATSKSSKNKAGKKAAAKKSDGRREIARAEQRLAKALADVDDAREKVQQRERDLMRLMRKHGHAPASTARAVEAPNSKAPPQGAPADGASAVDAESVEADPVEQPSEQLAADVGDEHHD